MNVLKTAVPAASLDDVVLDPKSPANINYVKARCVIEDTMNNRADRRTAKMVVIAHLKGEVQPVKVPATSGAPVPKQVVFADGSKARF